MGDDLEPAEPGNEQPPSAGDELDAFTAELEAGNDMQSQLEDIYDRLPSEAPLVALVSVGTAQQWEDAEGVTDEEAAASSGGGAFEDAAPPVKEI